MTLALLLSLLFHALLFSLTYGGQGTGLPGFGLPWQDRRAEVPVLQVVLAPGPAAVDRTFTPAEKTPPPTGVEQPRAEGLVLAPSISVDTPPGWPAATVLPPAQRADDVVAGPAGITPPPAEAAVAAVRQPTLNPLTRPDRGSWTVPVTPAPPAPVFVTTPSASSPATAAPPRLDVVEAAPVRTEPEVRDRADETAQADRARLEAQRQAELLEAARQETARQDVTRTEAARLDTERQEAERQEIARQDAARQEAVRQDTALAEAIRLEAERQEAARQEATRQDAARKEAARVEAARRDAARAEATLLEAGRQAARIEQAQEAETRREATLRAIGRQLDEEAARRDAASATARQSLAPGPSSSSVRRGRLFGRADSNAALVLYAEGWSRKVQLNQTFEMVREAAKQAHVDPIVTVAVRSDGSVESVSFVRPSGVAALDDAIRRVVQSQLPYQAFPPALAAEYDVVEIRRTWVFDMAIRLH